MLGGRGACDFAGYWQRTLHGLFGVIILVRAHYALLASSDTGWVPLAEQLGIAGGYTAGCQYFMARFCAEQSYEEIRQQFHDIFRADGRELKAFEMVREVGSGLEGLRQTESRSAPRSRWRYARRSPGRWW